MGAKHVRTLVAALMALLLPVAATTTVAQAEARAPSARTWTVQVGSQARHMAIQGMRFLPGSITVDAGDTVTWVARSAEIHTVTFLVGGKPTTSLPEFNPTDLKQLTRQGGSVYDSHKAFNSGLMTTVGAGGDSGPLPPVRHVHRYSLTFPHTGTFTYYCLVHGKMMVGVVHVQRAGRPYPHTQRQYNHRARVARAGLEAMGVRLLRDLQRRSTRHRVFMGDDNGAVAVMLFVRRTVVIHRGQTVAFRNVGMGEPHTVTFGKEPPPPAVFGPSGNPKHYAGGKLNSGMLGPHSPFRVTFTKSGTFHYVCALHDFMGMDGKVVVRR
jgi:plastocyanin